MPSVNLSQETYEKLKSLAAEKGCTPDELVQRSMADYIEGRDRTPEQRRREWNKLIESFRLNAPREVSEEQVQADLAEAVRQARAERRAGGR